VGEKFIEKPFERQERVWRDFRTRMVHSAHTGGHHEEGKDGLTVILELGAGMSTPGVLRWPNEDLVSRGHGKIKLIRIGLEAAGCVDWGNEDMVGVTADIGRVFEILARSGRPAASS
jgi:hypothetical protein